MAMKWLQLAALCFFVGASASPYSDTMADSEYYPGETEDTTLSPAPNASTANGSTTLDAVSPVRLRPGGLVVHGASITHWTESEVDSARGTCKCKKKRSSPVALLPLLGLSVIIVNNALCFTGSLIACMYHKRRQRAWDRVHSGP